MNPNTDRMMAWAQIGFSVLIFVLVAATLLVLETGHANMSAEMQKPFERDIGWLKDAALVVLYFWFQRGRQGGIPDSGQVVTQTHTTPDGTKVVTTTPVSAVKTPLVQTQPEKPQ